MRINENGFTLIESIVTFAILAIVGTMFVIGFYNVSSIMGEGIYIKNQTNILYEDILHKTELSSKNKLIFHFENDEILDAECNVITSSNTINTSDDISIKFVKYIPLNILDESEPNGGNEDDYEYVPPVPQNDVIKFNFMILKPNILPQDILITESQCLGETVHGKYYPLSYQINLPKDSEFKLEETILFNEQEIERIFNNEATLKTTVNDLSLFAKVFPTYDRYNEDIVWFQLQKINDYEYNVIGYIVGRYSGKSQLIILDAYGNIKYQFSLSVDDKVIKQQVNQQLDGNPGYMYSVDGEIYSKQDMLDLVLSDKTKLYIFLEKPEV